VKTLIVGLFAAFFFLLWVVYDGSVKSDAFIQGCEQRGGVAMRGKISGVKGMQQYGDWMCISKGAVL
jgi:hypothetical protein